jgi:hypothetical protein
VILAGATKDIVELQHKIGKTGSSSAAAQDCETCRGVVDESVPFLAFRDLVLVRSRSYP